MSTPPVSVLYVDDDPGLTRLIQRTLGRRGYTVEIASTTEQGLERIARAEFDVVALDHFLPTGTGLDSLGQRCAACLPCPPWSMSPAPTKPLWRSPPSRLVPRIMF